MQTLFGGLGENLVKWVFVSVYCRLAVNSIEKSERWEVSQNLLARIVVTHFMEEMSYVFLFTTAHFRLGGH